MKKVTFILLALISGTAFGQNATAPVNAEIIEPIAVSSDGALNFGSFIAPATGQATVEITADGSNRIFSDTKMEIPTLATIGVPTFTVTKDAALNYKTAIAVTIIPKETGGDTMALSALTASNGPDANTEATFTVGGTLTVDAGQTPGNYLGEIEVTLSYE